MMSWARRFYNFIRPMVGLLVYYGLALSLSWLLPDLGPIFATISVNVIVVIAYLVWSNKHFLDDKPRAKLSWSEFMVWAVLGFVVWLMGQLAAAYLLSTVGDASYELYKQSTLQVPPYLVLILFLLAPFAEEMLLRGYTYRAWRKHSGPWWALLASSLLFAIMHGTRVHFIPTFMLGMLAALMYERTRSIKWPIVTHLLYNISAIVFGGFIIPDFMGGPLFFGPGIVLCLLTIVWLYRNVLIGGRIDGKKTSCFEEADDKSGTSEEDAGGERKSCSSSEDGRGVRRARLTDKPATLAHSTYVRRVIDEDKEA